MYTIYFGYKPSGRRKIGCDKDYPNRPIQQNMTNYRILEQHEDIFIASDREQELQAEYGLRVDPIPYWQMIENGRVKSERKKIAVKRNYAAAGLIGARSKSEAKVNAARENTKKRTEASKKRITCSHCGKDANTGNYARWHGDNCKHKNI